MMSSSNRTPIGPDDTIQVVGSYLVHNRTGERFWVKGIAFPTPPLVSKHPGSSTQEDVASLQYNEHGWNAVLEQVAADLDINTVRVYRMNCTLDYSPFFERAAELGIYVIVPLTSASGDGVLDRNLPAPDCYPMELFGYGVSCLNQYLRHPNVLAAMIGNEVMNSLLTWTSAPCVRAYGRDLKAYMMQRQTQFHRQLPLLYAAQHDSPDASVLPEVAMKLTANYLSCVDDDDERGEDGSVQHNETSVDIYGINVESWCSSLQTFELDEDGLAETAYHSLWRTLSNSSIPLIFSETGCSKVLFNRDNGLARYVRDWHQVPVILNNMSSVFSGFCAYTYDGNPLFRMMDGEEPWDGVHVLPPSQDYLNFQYQLNEAVTEMEKDRDGKPHDSFLSPPPISCEEASADLEHFWKLQLPPLSIMPSYVLQIEKYRRRGTMSPTIVCIGTASACSPNATSPPFPVHNPTIGNGAVWLITLLLGSVLGLIIFSRRLLKGKQGRKESQQDQLVLLARPGTTQYGTVPSGEQN